MITQLNFNFQVNRVHSGITFTHRLKGVTVVRLEKIRGRYLGIVAALTGK